MSSLLSLVDKKQSFCLNTADSAAWGLFVASAPAAAVRSDSGAQLILHLPFMEPVRVEALAVDARASSGAAVTVKLWANQTSFAFEDAESVPPTQVLPPAAAGGAAAEPPLRPLRVAKFATCTALTIMLDAGDEGELTLAALRLVGSAAGLVADVSNIKAAHEHE